jgi:hypothetical protein
LNALDCDDKRLAKPRLRWRRCAVCRRVALSSENLRAPFEQFTTGIVFCSPPRASGFIFEILTANREKHGPRLPATGFFLQSGGLFTALSRSARHC